MAGIQLRVRSPSALLFTRNVNGSKIITYLCDGKVLGDYGLRQGSVIYMVIEGKKPS